MTATQRVEREKNTRGTCIFLQVADTRDLLIMFF